jgi:malate permease and related proteins
MDFLTSFKITFDAIIQILLMGAVGFILVSCRKITKEGARFLSFFVVDIALPLFTFTHLVKNFSFSFVPNWWLFLLISLAIIVFGYLVGYLLTVRSASAALQKESMSLHAFQNSGWLPLILADLILTGQARETMLVYIFLYLVGFNLLVWSAGVSFLMTKRKPFEFASMFSPPVIAALAAFAVILLRVDKAIPDFLMQPAESIGKCTVPLAMVLVGANLAESGQKGKFDIQVLLVVFGKLIIMPGLAFLLLLKLDLLNLIGLLVVIECAMPSATTLSIIAVHYNIEERLLNRGIFWTHIASLITIPVFLGLFFWLGQPL